MSEPRDEGEKPFQPVGDVVIVVPCFNEGERLQGDRFVAFARRNLRVRFLFVDDGSTDHTLEVLTRLREIAPESIEFMSLDRNVGKAEAVRLGIVRALEVRPSSVGYWDADLATPLEQIQSFQAILDDRPEIYGVLGARVLMLGRSIRRRATRHYLGRVFATAASLATGLAVYDTQCGAKLFRCRREVAAAFQEPFLSRWIFDVELLVRLISQCEPRVFAGDEEVAGIIESPLECWEDVAGSKVRAADFCRAFFELVGVWRLVRRQSARVLAVGSGGSDGSSTVCNPGSLPAPKDRPQEGSVRRSVAIANLEDRREGVGCPQTRSWDTALVSLLVLATFAAHAGVIRGGFVWDDWYKLEHVKYAGLLEQATHFWPLHADTQALPNLHWWIFWRMFRLEEAWYLGANLFIHACNVVLLFVLVRRLGAVSIAAGAATLLFAAAPTLIPVVGWTSTATEYGYAAMTALLAMLLWHRSYGRAQADHEPDGRGGGLGKAVVPLVAAGLCFLSMKSKVQAIALPLLLVFTMTPHLGHCRLPGDRRRLPALSLSVVGSLVGMLLVVSTVRGSSYGTSTSGSFANACNNITGYGGLMLFPSPWRMSLRYVLWLPLVAVPVGAIWLCILGRRHGAGYSERSFADHLRSVVLGGVALVAFLAPTLPLVNHQSHGHVYLLSVACCITLSGLLSCLLHRAALRPVMVAGLTSGLLWLAWVHVMPGALSLHEQAAARCDHNRNIIHSVVSHAAALVGKKRLVIGPPPPCALMDSGGGAAVRLYLDLHPADLMVTVVGDVCADAACVGGGGPDVVCVQLKGESASLVPSRSGQSQASLGQER
jgi:dolichyl-phosphate beta-glucosyltransferase